MSTDELHPTFKDSLLEQAFERNGFVVVQGVDSNILRQAYGDLRYQIPSKDSDSPGQQSINVTYHCTFLEQEAVYKRQVMEKVQTLLRPLTEEFLVDHQVYQANLFIKPPGTGHVCPHQNLTTVDERQFTSVSLWCPIQDTDVKNGTIHVLRGSHRRFERFRNFNIHWPWLQLFPHILSHGMEPVAVRAGEVLVFNDSIVHGSPDNLSDSDRVVFHALAAPSNAPLVYAHPADGQVFLHQVDGRFWQEHYPDREPELGPLLRAEPWSSSDRTERELAHELA